MKAWAWLCVGMSLTAGAVAGACGGTTANHAAPASDGGAPDASKLDAQAEAAVDAGPACQACTTDSSCSGGAVCAELGSNAYCAAPCPASGACPGDTTCAVVNTAAGSQTEVCAPRSGVCSVPVSDAGFPAMCGALVGPQVDAGCTCQSFEREGGPPPPGDGGGYPHAACGANGCRMEEYCNTTNDTCQPPPIGCVFPGQSYDGGAPPTGSVGVDGGAVSRLYFGVVGDTRPPNVDDTSGYPTAVITKIFQDLQALSPPPTFVVATGDYQYATPTGAQGAIQLGLYATARAGYSGVVFPTMGNHECTGATASNCGAGNADGLTNNYDAFVQTLLTPIGQTSPYFEIDVNATDQSWTSKFLFVAANAWTQTQANWLAAAMTRTTTYTFIVRHEEAAAGTAPGVNPSENIMAMHPYTLSIVGHTHTYQHSGPREIIIGNGGAPLSGGVDYGYGMLSQQADGSMAVDVIDYTTGLADSSFHFAVNPDGSPAP